MENELDEVDMSDSHLPRIIYETSTRKIKLPLGGKRDCESFKQIDISMLRAHQETISIQPWIFTTEAHSIIWRKAELFWSFVVVVAVEERI